MKGTLTQNEQTVDATQEAIDQALAVGALFWLDLDLHDPGPDDDVSGMLVNTFHFHPVAVEAADQFGQRARIDDYDDFVHIVTFGMAADGKTWPRCTASSPTSASSPSTRATARPCHACTTGSPPTTPPRWPPPRWRSST